MTLKEAIVHTESKAEEIEKSGCHLCAEEHRQLASWLKELLEYRTGKKA